MNIENLKHRTTFNILFLIIILALAILHILGVIKFDAISLSLIFLSVLPFLFPYLTKNFKSFEIFGIKAELIEKLEKQEVELKNQQEIINKLVIYSMAFYLDAMLRDFLKCEKGEMQEYIFKKTRRFEHRIEYLIDTGFLEKSINPDKLVDGENIAIKVKLTPIGKYYVELRNEFENA
jgi:hypothetical protein